MSRRLEDGTSENSTKRIKKTVDAAVVEEFTCPITHDLPVDPVIAEDGRTYERSAIEEYFRRGGEIPRSPVTNLPVGTQLIPAFGVRNMLEKFVTEGVIDEEKAALWKERIANKVFVANMRSKAESGDANAMNKMGVFYESGTRIKKNMAEAFKWYNRAADAGHFSGMGSLGMMHILGNGTDRNIPEGLALLCVAAQGGSCYAAHYLGKFYYYGEHGLIRNERRARYWLERVVDETECSKEIMLEARDLLALLSRT